MKKVPKVVEQMTSTTTMKMKKEEEIMQQPLPNDEHRQ